MMPSRLTGEKVLLRPVRPGEEEILTRILATPEVAPWWSMPDAEELAGMMAIVVGHAGVSAAEVGSAAEARGEGENRDDAVVGAIEFDEENTPDYRHAGIDIFLDPGYHGRGLGADAVRTLARWLIEERGHHRLTIDPAAANIAAIRCYAKVGFRPVGVMRQYERAPQTGLWRDGLLMDLLATELR
jgi:aminoglycoside 6'-N-acetyltransferase